MVALAAAAALAGKDYLIERNLLPALVPLAAAVAIGFATARARRLGLVLAVALCAYWLAFDLYVTQTPNLQRPDFRDRRRAPRPARTAAARSSAGSSPPPFRWYLTDGAVRMYSGAERLREVDIVGKPVAAARPVNLPRSFHLARRVELTATHPQPLRLETPRENPLQIPARAADRLRRRRHRPRRPARGRARRGRARIGLAPRRVAR